MSDIEDVLARLWPNFTPGRMRRTVMRTREEVEVRQGGRVYHERWDGTASVRVPGKGGFIIIGVVSWMNVLASCNDCSVGLLMIS